MTLIDPTDYYRLSLDAALHGTYRVHGDMAQADCIIAAAFGQREAGVVGLSNQGLADFILTLPDMPRIMQQEIAQALSTEQDDFVIAQARESGQRLDTLEFLEQAQEYMRHKGYGQAVLVGHPNHVPWLDFLCGQIGIATVVPAGLGVIPFDPQSSQAWTRSLVAWQEEVLARQRAGDERRAVS